MDEPSDTMVGTQRDDRSGDPVGVPQGFYAGPARSASDIDAARELHTRAYIEQGYIVGSVDRLFDDGWMDHREWLVVADGPNVVGTTSLITPTHTLPTLEAFGIGPLGDVRIGPACRQGRLVEVSTLGRDRRVQPGVLIRALLYRVLWMSAARRGDHDIWVMSMPIERLWRLALLFPVPFEPLSGVKVHYRHPCVASALDLRLARVALQMRAVPLLLWLDGLSADFGLVTTPPGPHE